MAFPFPELMRVRQEFERPKVDDLQSSVSHALNCTPLSTEIREGDEVAITAGSRGIANITPIIRTIVDYVRFHAGVPFVVPSMGSHGGATAEGQVRVLSKLGMTEETLGCPIRSSMETECVGKAPQGFDLHFDKVALQADHVIVCNRVKPHTSIGGDIESGLVKMLLIGLGNHLGAQIYHRALADHSFSDIANSVVDSVIDRCRIRAGIGIVENAYEETAIVEGMSATELVEREKQLLVTAKKLIARIPFEQVDVLLIDEIGKNISGTGMDTNVVGRKSNDHVAIGNEKPQVKRICVRSLTEKSGGNATGIGIAEFCHRRVLDQMDRESTRINCLTSLHPTGGMIPLSFESDREMLEAAFTTVGLTPAEDSRFLWIANTLDLEHFVCSSRYRNQVPDHPKLEIVDDHLSFDFDDNGDLVKML